MSVYPEGVAPTRKANISADGRYRYSLHRDWRGADDETGLWPRMRWITFIMLNPSTADAQVDDPTIRRCVGFARAMGGTGLAVVNLYAFRATHPADLWRTEDPVGSRNNETLSMFLDMALKYDFPIVAAWGANARPDRVAEVLAMPGAERLVALGNTGAGAPRHPLYLPAGAIPRPWPMTKGIE